MPFPALYLKKREEKRLFAGHLWIYSNEVDTKRSPLKEFNPGDCVNVLTANGKPLGSAYINPHSLIVARKFSERTNQVLDVEFFKTRFQQALALRECFFHEPYYRLVFSEGDYLPGLIVDRYNQTFVLQVNTAGLENVKKEIILAIDELFNPETIVFRNDSGSRALENLERITSVEKGSASESTQCKENDTQFSVDVLNGQKTGWFYDQRINRKNTLSMIKNKMVLDVFSYTGSWTVPIANHGAESVTAIDISQPALDILVSNAEQNQVSDKITVLCDDAFNAMKELKNANKSFDIVVIDPPAFIKRKKDLKEGGLAYQRANQLAMSLVKSGGIIISSSCSYHMSLANLQNALLRASRKLQRPMQIIQYGGQGFDHPIHPAIEETNYLKTIFARIL